MSVCTEEGAGLGGGGGPCPADTTFPRDGLGAARVPALGLISLSLLAERFPEVCFPPKPHGLFPTRRASRWWWALWVIHPVGLLPQVSSCQTPLEGMSGGVRPPPRLFHPVRRVARRRRAGAAGRGASAPGSDPAAVSPAGREAGSQAPCGPESPAALPSLPCWDPGAGEPLAWVRPPRDHITRVPGPGGWEEERWARRQQGPGPSAAIRARGPPRRCGRGSRAGAPCGALRGFSEAAGDAVV